MRGERERELNVKRGGSEGERGEKEREVVERGRDFVLMGEEERRRDT